MAGLPMIAFILAEAAAAPSYGPSPPPKPVSAAKKPADDCAPQSGNTKDSAIVICAVKPDGYRLPPDIVEARRLKKKGDAGRPHNPHETYADTSCASVGPMGCTGTPSINFLAVAAVAAEISQRLAKGQEVGSIFKTTPHASEYQYYLEAKKTREEKEADAAAKKVQADAQGKAAPPTADLHASAPTNR